MATTAWEDTSRAKADAAPVTTVSTPGESDVTVTAPTDTPPVIIPPAQPFVDRTGLH
jgi:hypothetical protein